MPFGRRTFGFGKPSSDAHMAEFFHSKSDESEAVMMVLGETGS